MDAREDQTRCPGCSSSGNHAQVETHGRYTLRTCRVCDLTFSDPMDGAGQSWYEEHQEYAFRDMMRADAVRWNHRQFLAERPAPGSELLDVGCGPGGFLRAALTAGYRIAGLDFDRRAIEIAVKRHGIQDVHALSLSDFADVFPGRRFDIITFFEVLEHQDSPTRFLEGIVRLLKPGGLIALSVPFRDRRPAIRFSWDYPPHHLTRWSQAALESFLQRAGFTVQTLRIGWPAGANTLRQCLGTARITSTLSGSPRSGVLGLAGRMAATPFVVASGLAVEAAGRIVDMALRPCGATGIDMYARAELVRPIPNGAQS